MIPTGNPFLGNTDTFAKQGESLFKTEHMLLLLVNIRWDWDTESKKHALKRMTTPAFGSETSLTVTSSCGRTHFICHQIDFNLYQIPLSSYCRRLDLSLSLSIIHLIIKDALESTEHIFLRREVLSSLSFTWVQAKQLLLLRLWQLEPQLHGRTSSSETVSL